MLQKELQHSLNWAKHTTIKSSDELTTAKDKRLRTICQIGNIAFSLLSLGVFIPLYTRSKTNKKRAEELAMLKAEAQAKSQTDTNSLSTAQTSSDSASGKTSADDFSKQLIKDSTAFKSFVNS